MRSVLERHSLIGLPGAAELRHWPIFSLMHTLAVRAAGGRISSLLMAAVNSLPIALGPILGPVIGRRDPELALSWRWLFLVNVPLIAAGLLLARRLLPTDRPEPGAVRTRLD